MGSLDQVSAPGWYSSSLDEGRVGGKHSRSHRKRTSTRRSTRSSAQDIRKIGQLGNTTASSQCLVCQIQHELPTDPRHVRRSRTAEVEVQHAVGDAFNWVGRKIKTKWDGRGKAGCDEGAGAKHGDRPKKDNAEDEDANYLVPKNPVIFCPGLFGFDTVKLGIPIFEVEYWQGIKEKLKEKGVEALMTESPPTSGPEERAIEIMKTVNEKYADKSVHFIGYSMGGIDCRYLASKLKNQCKFKILSITTIGTPHLGTSFADFVMKNAGKALPELMKFLNWLPILKGTGEGIAWLTRKQMELFNKDVPDVPGLKYFSWGARADPSDTHILKLSHSIIMEKEGDNDGMVSVKSSAWGTYKGTLKNVDHMDLIGWVSQVKNKISEIRGRKVEFVPHAFYFKILDQLAREVEGQTAPVQVGAVKGRNLEQDRRGRLQDDKHRHAHHIRRV